MMLSKREQYIAIATGIVVGLLLLDQLALTPWLARLKAADGQIADAQQVLQRADQTHKLAQRSLSRWHQLAGGTLSADASAAESQIYNATASWARSSGLSLDQVDRVRSENEEGFVRITIRATANGTMSQISQFIFAAQNSHLPVRITDTQISTRREGTDDLALQIGLATIYQPKPQPAAQAINTVAVYMEGSR